MAVSLISKAGGQGHTRKTPTALYSFPHALSASLSLCLTYTHLLHLHISVSCPVNSHRLNLWRRYSAVDVNEGWSGFLCPHPGLLQRRWDEAGVDDGGRGVGEVLMD